MKKSSVLLTLAFTSFLLVGCGGSSVSSTSLESSKEESSSSEIERTLPSYPLNDDIGDSGVGYEIFVGSYRDSNSDGIGDLNGIKDSLGYLKTLGITYAWLTPVHPSSTYHHYDVEDYFDISNDFGTVDDFVSLCQEAKENGIQIIMDMVFNHASTKSSLFLEAIDDFVNENESENSKADYFHFSYKMPTDLPSQKVVYRTYNYQGKTVFYECDFDSTMADFNLESEKVRSFHKSIMEYWLEKGASGFRFDGCAYYFAGEKNKSVEYCTYLANTAKSIKEDVYLIGEAWDDSVSHQGLAGWSASGMRFFNFANSCDYGSTSWNFYAGQSRGVAAAKQVYSLQNKLLKKTSDSEPACFLSNHDQDRFISSFNIFALDNDREERIRATVSMYLLTPGTPFMYYGEEIRLVGLRGGTSTDANRRLPFLWSGTNDPYRCKDPIGATQSQESRPTKGLSEELEDSSSLVRHYIKTIDIRKKVPAIRYGVYSAIETGSDPLCLMQIDYEGDVYYIAHNFSKEKNAFTIPTQFEILDEIDTVGVNAKQEGANLTLSAWSSAVLKKVGA